MWKVRLAATSIDVAHSREPNKEPPGGLPAAFPPAGTAQAMWMVLVSM